MVLESEGRPNTPSHRHGSLFGTALKVERLANAQPTLPRLAYSDPSSLRCRSASVRDISVGICTFITPDEQKRSGSDFPFVETMSLFGRIYARRTFHNRIARLLIPSRIASPVLKTIHSHLYFTNLNKPTVHRTSLFFNS